MPANEPTKPADAVGADATGGDHAPLLGHRWAATNPWFPRVLPFLVYVAFFLAYPLREIEGLGWTYPLIYGVQCAVTAFLLFRYRRLLPEITMSFHWLALPVGVGVFLFWIGLGYVFAGLPREGMPHAGWNFFAHMSPEIAWTAMVMRLLGMSILVPIFEELFVRSLLLRSFADWKQTRIGVMQFLVDIPLIGDWLINTKAGEAAHKHDPVFGREFHRHTLGKLTVCGVVLSSAVFMINHAPRDWVAAFACGVCFCLLLGATRKRGLGPVIWAHGITNALIWAYTVYMHFADGRPADWRFL